jgi:peptide/nickel transport system substrate-binding protein
VIRSRCLCAATLLLLLVSCAGPAADPVPTARAAPVATPTGHAPEIRYALIGQVTDVNVWALFDAEGYSYNNYAVRNEYWPRLYGLSIPDREFVPVAADGMPPPVKSEGKFYTATVALRSGLKWTDGSPFTASDVVFTVNTALAFQLGFDWHDFYAPDWLDRAEAVDAQTVKFYFKKPPNVGAWQYGVLQGPIVQRAYWESRVSGSVALLPPAGLAAQIEALRSRVVDRQSQVDALTTIIATTPMPPGEAQQAQTELRRKQKALNEANNDLNQAQAEFDLAMSAARESLYVLGDADEPTLGNWMPAGKKDGIWTNEANPAYPFGEPHFDRASYRVFANEQAAVRALQGDEVDSISSENGLSAQAAWALEKDTALRVVVNSNRTGQFLVFNAARPGLTDPILRRGLDCMVNRAEISSFYQVALLESFVPPGPWRNSEVDGTCAKMDDLGRVKTTLALLKNAGYKWTQEPISVNEAGNGLALPGGEPFPPLNLLAPLEDHDKPYTLVASYLQDRLRYFAIPVTNQQESAVEIKYAVYGSGDFDAALLGWRVSEYPGYLCDWFEAGNPFGYHSDRLQSACAALNSTSDLEAARRQVFEIQSVLAQDLPFLPLYSGVTYDVYRNVTYPFDSLPGGLSGVYGAPSVAVPASQ